MSCHDSFGEESRGAVWREPSSAAPVSWVAVSFARSPRTTKPSR